MMTESHEALEGAFNALWRENLAWKRRLSPACWNGAPCAVIALPGGAELLAPVRAIAAFGLLRTGFPYYLRRPDASGTEEIDTAVQLLEALPHETGAALSRRWNTRNKGDRT